MICLIALFVFGVLAIFSASYRPLAKEAFDCVFRKITFRKCKTNLDQRIKGDLVGRSMRRSPWFARFLHKRFEILSWIFTILLILSLVQSGISIYYWAAYGNCNGPNESGFCIFNSVAVTEQGCDSPNCTGENCGVEPCGNVSCGCDPGDDCIGDSSLAKD